MALTITCPICGKRNGYEFRFGGEDKGPKPPEAKLNSEKWCDYIHINALVQEGTVWRKCKSSDETVYYLRSKIRGHCTS